MIKNKDIHGYEKVNISHTARSVNSLNTSDYDISLEHDHEHSHNHDHDKESNDSYPSSTNDTPDQLTTIDFRLIPKTTDKNWWMVYMPIIYWFPRYRWKEWLLYDSIAAITAVVMVIPQGMGYALVAGLQPIYGLYSALWGHCIYGPFGTSGQLIVASVAIVSFMTKETLHTYHDHIHASGDVELSHITYAAYASALSFQVGIISVALGLLRAGTLANMLAEPVLVGFTFAAAILIGVSQLPFIFNIEVEGEELVDVLTHFFKHIEHAHGQSILLACCCMVFLLIIKAWKSSEKLPYSKYAKFIPDALILVIVTTAISSALGASTGWDVVGPLPDGLPQFLNFFDYLHGDDFWSLWVNSILIAVIAFIESIAVASKFADKHCYEVNASQELIALGICNLIGCWFQAYPVSGVLALATVVEAAGAKTPLYSIMAGLGICICAASILFLFEWLPKPVLGAIVLVSITSLIDIATMKEIYHINRRDFFIMIITILCTLFLGVDYGVALGVVVSILLFIQQAAKPHYAVLGKIEYDDGGAINHNDEESAMLPPVYRNIKEYPDAQQRDDMLFIRWDAPIFFGNTQSFKTRIRKHINRKKEKFHNKKRKKWCLVIDFSGVNEMDYTGIESFKHFIIDLKAREKNMTLLICKIKPQVLTIFKKAKIMNDDVIHKNNILYELHSAESYWDHHCNSSQSQISSNMHPLIPTISMTKTPDVIPEITEETTTDDEMHHPPQTKKLKPPRGPTLKRFVPLKHAVPSHSVNTDDESDDDQNHHHEHHDHIPLFHVQQTC